MTRPRLVSCYFGPDPDHRWARLATVLRYTAELHEPGWEIDVAEIAPKLPTAGTRGQNANTAKLTYWQSRVEAAADGDRVLLIDADTFLTNPIDDVWRDDFDIAYTTKDGRFPFNGGVVFVRVSPATRLFMSAWVAENATLVGRIGAETRNRFGGVNQASLSRILARFAHGPRIIGLSCHEWNCEDESWHRFDPAVTRIVHVKGRLRLACLGTQPVPPDLAGLRSIWRGLDREARERVAS